MLLERGKLETPNKNSRSKARNQQRTQPTNYTGWIWDLSNVPRKNQAKQMHGMLIGQELKKREKLTKKYFLGVFFP